jgi:hypothetical protein
MSPPGANRAEIVVHSVGATVPFGAWDTVSVRVFVVDHEDVALTAEGVVLTGRLALRAGAHVAVVGPGFGCDNGGRDSQRHCRGERGAERGFHENGHHFVLSVLERGVFDLPGQQGLTVCRLPSQFGSKAMRESTATERDVFGSKADKRHRTTRWSASRILENLIASSRSS